jgi:hypothetical protein
LARLWRRCGTKRSPTALRPRQSFQAASPSLRCKRSGQARPKLLLSDATIRLHAYDETNRRVIPPVGADRPSSRVVDQARVFLAAVLPAGNQQHTAARTIGCRHHPPAGYPNGAGVGVAAGVQPASRSVPPQRARIRRHLLRTTRPASRRRDVAPASPCYRPRVLPISSTNARQLRDIRATAEADSRRVHGLVRPIGRTGR